MKIEDIDQFCYEIFFKKLYYLNNKKEVIYYDYISSIVIAKPDRPYSLKDKIKFFNFPIDDFVPISDENICIIYRNNILENTKYIIIKSLKNNNNFYQAITHKHYEILQVKFFKEKNQLILIQSRDLYIWKFNENLQTCQFSSKLTFDKKFVFNILNKKTFIISTDDCLLLYNSNTLTIKKKIYYDDEEIDENNINIEEEDEDIGTEGNYLNQQSQNNILSSCLSKDKKYLAISSSEGRLLIYNTKNFKKEKIKKFKNYSISYLPSYSYNKTELEEINTIKINNIKPVSNFFVLDISYIFEKNSISINYRRNFIPLRKIGNIWNFGFFVNKPFTLTI